MFNVVYKRDWHRLLKHQIYAWMKPIDTAEITFKRSDLQKDTASQYVPAQGR